ncbi:dihydrofolate reductase family protein [Denitrobaculum tricleocarpae]|uniref:Dihydrofolate reductase n=1 Tax=Denitrobaculum tricleocarpae TaxID=2591009 RepID=A0A545U2V1_9PROT|nr:dihydrofolate reductase family protein [Denitrobaculum tricleocarpae]TQV83805.1 dihydrofolate reductase [Denitrobaculum tricleocarpae]
MPRELAILTFQTLDGVMQAPRLPDEDSSGGFTRGGWADPHWDGVMEQVGKFAMAEPYDLLLGRKTYELFAPHFSGAGDTNPMNSARKYVATSTLSQLDWNNSVALSGDVAQDVKALKSQDGPLLQVHGSWQLIQTLLAEHLIDEFRIWSFPVLVGPGKRLFGEGAMPRALKLVKSDTTSSGAVMSIYR